MTYVRAVDDIPEVDEEELVEHDGSRPVEEVGPDQADPGAVRCETDANAGEGPQDAQFMPDDELHESFPVEPIRGYIASDGLPSFAMPNPEQSEAIPFAYETVVCVEDDREYVELFSEELAGRGWIPSMENRCVASLHESKPPGVANVIKLMLRHRYDESGAENSRATFAPEEVEHLWGTHLVKHEDGSWIPLRMKRERCEHYRRQVFSNDEVPDPEAFGHKIVFRNCAARRSNGGAYLSLRDEGVYSCDYRTPRDEPSIAAQDKIDSAKLRDRPHLRRLPLFGLPGEEIHLKEAGN